MDPIKEAMIRYDDGRSEMDQIEEAWLQEFFGLEIKDTRLKEVVKDKMCNQCDPEKKDFSHDRI